MSNINQKSRSKITARKWYTDIDLNLTAHPSSRDLSLKYDKDAVKRSLRNIMLTNNFERPFKPNFGANLRAMIFEANDPIIGQRIKERIAEQIKALEPRIGKVVVGVNQRDNSIDIRVAYTISGSASYQEVEFSVSRVR